MTTLHPAACVTSSSRRQQLRKAELVPVWISDVKEALAPGRISRRISDQSLRLHLPIMRVHVIDPENRPTPPAMVISRTRSQIDEGSTGFQTAERRALAAIYQLKAKLSVECR